MASSNLQPQSNSFEPKKVGAAALEAVAGALSNLRYGAIVLTVHDGRVVQLDITERQRFT